MKGAWDSTPVEPSLILPGVSANTSQMLGPLPSVAFAPSTCRRCGNTLKVLQMLQQLLHELADLDFVPLPRSCTA